MAMPEQILVSSSLDVPVTPSVQTAHQGTVPLTDAVPWAWQLQHRARDIAGLERLRPGITRSVAFTSISNAGAFAAADSSGFRFEVTPYYLGLVDFDNPSCPIAAQIFPRTAEQNDRAFPDDDPLAEESHMPVPGLTHRYPDRVLWYLSHHCAVYCRFCMRKRKVSRPESAPDFQEFADALTYIETTPGIKEVILSGGDPLSLSDDRLDFILTRLKQVPSLSSVRIHTRMPVTLPMRITIEFAGMLRRHFPLTLVTHFNHPAEITSDAAAAVKRLRMNGVLVLNQSVLLNGVNDTVEIQEALLLGLLRIGAKPYYLHQCDEVRGVSHFRVQIRKGKEILRGLRGRNPGIAIPRYVIDLPGGGGKVPLEPDYEITEPAGGNDSTAKTHRLRFQNSEGRIFSVRRDDDAPGEPV